MARQALRQLGAIQETATYSHVYDATYDTTTGTVSTSSDTVTLPVVFGNYTNREILRSEGQIEKNDRPALIVPSDFGEVVPQFGDTITRTNGEIWRICENGIGLDPAEALYVMQMRKTDVSDS